MIKLNDELPTSMDVMPDPAGMGRGWTVIYCGEDEKGPFEEWIGQFFKTYDEAVIAAHNWKK